jgi:hypothetical protein
METRICATCNTPKPIDDFCLRNRFTRRLMPEIIERNIVKGHGSMTVIVDGTDGLDGNFRSIFSDKMEEMAKKTPGGKPYSQSSNPVVARSSGAGGASNPMQYPETSAGLILLLLTRLERISVDSYWAHRASGVRGALTKVLGQMEMGEPVDPASLRMNLQVGFEVLRKAAEEYL